MSNNIFIQAVRVLFLDLLAEILYFPVWWYTAGFFNILLNFANNLRQAQKNLGLGLLFRYMFQPMFGQYDRAGRVISFFMRLVIVTYKSILFVVQFIFYLAVVVFWLVLPLVVVTGIFYNLSALWQK